MRMNVQVNAGWKNALILSVFFLLSFIGILHHEIWLDEAQHFLLARDSRSLSELVYNCRFEGHPLLWNVLLFLVTRFTTQIFYMQLLHILISCITAFIICRFNISLFEKIVIIFSYYLFFEYNIISRNYGLSGCLMFLLLYIFQNDQKALIRMALVIFFLANAHLFSLIISVAFVLTYILNKKDLLLKQERKVLICATLIIITGWLLAAWSIIPPGDYTGRFMSYDTSGYFSGERILKTISVCLKGIFYIPDYSAPDHQFWNSLWYRALHLMPWVIFLLSLASILIPLLILKRNKFAFTMFGIYLVLFLPLYFFLPLVHGIRYFGFLYLLFVFCFIIARSQVKKTWLTISLMIFTLQFINGIYAYSMDLLYPFSEGKEMSEYLEKVKKGHEQVYILDPTLRPAISVYTGEKYFGVENGQMLTFCRWNDHLPDPVLKLKLSHALNSDTDSYVITNKPFRGLIDTTRILRLISFSNGIVGGENAVIYRYMGKNMRKILKCW